MSLDTLFEQDTSRALDRMARLPPEPTPPPDRGFWSALPRGIGGGAAKFGAAAIETIDAALGEDYNRRRRARFGDSIPDNAKTARSMREWERELRPDPATAGLAEQFVYGMGSVLTEAVPGAAVAGPWGAMATIGASEGLSAAADLPAKVDKDTRANVGFVTGALSAVGAVLPFAGSTLAKTAALWAAGGPGSFVAQQALTRSILRRADYADIAKQYDPYDPTGLVLSAAPGLPFAGYRAWQLSRATKTPTPSPGIVPPSADQAPAVPVAPREDVDAAMVHNLTLQQDAAERAPRVAADAPATPGIEPPTLDSATTAEVVTERGMAVQVRYRLAEADDLVTSHTDDLTTNPAFPVELQPRDRARAASADQVSRIENAIDPELLGASRKASDGAPIISPEGVVESGHARTIALRRAYGSGKAGAYRAWLAENAERFGINPDDVAGMQRPVLVRERTGDVDRAEFARQANESAIADMAPAERAKADAARMTDLDGMVANDDGTINMRESAGFIRRFIQSVAPTERGALMQADGRLSQTGQQRVRNAIFAKAYGDADLVAMLAESTDSNVRNILSGLLRAAPDVARLRDLVEAGARQPIDVAGGVAVAVRALASLREQGISVQQALDSGRLFDDALPPEIHNLLRGFDENARAPRRIAEMLRRMVQAVDDIGDPRQASLLGDAKPTAADVSADAVERLRTMTDEQLTGTPEAAPKVGADTLMRSVSDQAQTIEMTSPEMTIKLDEAGQPITVADELARVRREALEGTDAELGALDADLVRVAAECALSTGEI